MSAREDIIFKAGDVIFDTSEPLDLAYFILEGETSLQLRLKNKEVNILVGSNNFVGDASVAFQQKDSSRKLGYAAKAIAVTDVRATPILVSEIKDELEKCPAIIRAWFASFLKRTLILVENLTK